MRVSLLSYTGREILIGSTISFTLTCPRYRREENLRAISIQSVVLANSMPCHPRATSHIAGCCHLANSMWWSCHIAGCNNSIRHVETSFLPYFNFLGFFNAVWALTSGGFRIVSDTPTIATFYFGEIGVSSVCCEKLIIAQKYSSKVRPNFGTHSAPSDKTLASAKHYKGMLAAILLSTTIYSTTPNTILDLLTVDNDHLLVK